MSRIWSAACGLLLATTLSWGATAQELYVLDADGEPQLVEDAPTTPGANQPVLFVHGHNALDDSDTDFNFRKNWIDGRGNLPSFVQALRLPENADLGLEPYFIRFIDQSRSITEDAADIRDVIDQIIARHGPSSRVVIIAYSKGALSSRLALKSLLEQVEGLPAPQPAARPVSEFIAIAPPNHGLTTIAGLFGNSQSGAELHNGYSPPAGATGLCVPSGPSSARDFFERLNGHPLADSHADAVPLASYPQEAPGSRAPGSDPASGVLYVTIYASGNRDFVGGGLPPGAPGNTVEQTPDCTLPTKQGRVLARNLAEDAINLSLAGIPGDDALDVHANTVHVGDVICQALHTAVHHAPPTAGECQSGPASVPKIEPAQRVGVELVLDFSGSMQQPGCADCLPKSEVLAQAASLFIDLWQVVAAPGDRIGVTVFGSDARAMRCVLGEPCAVLAPDADVGDVLPHELLVPVRDMVGPVQTFIADQNAAGGTALGAGLHAAITQLQSFDGARKRIILLTDGMQNVAPALNYQPADCVDGACPLVLDQEPPLALDVSMGIPVDTIGVGVGDAWLGLLNDLSLATGGVSRATISPDDDLAAFFTDNIVDTLQGFSPQRVARHRGALTETPASHRFPVNANVRRVMLTVRGGVTARIARDEQDMTEQGRLISRTGYQLWTMALPAGPAGVWTVALEGKPGTKYDISLLVDEPALGFTVSAGRRSYVVGESLQLEATVTVGGSVIQSPVDVSVSVQRPSDTAANVLAQQTLFDVREAPSVEQAGTAAQRSFAHLTQFEALSDQLVTTTQSQPLTMDDRGRYAGQSAPLTVPGSRQLEFVVSGEHPQLGRFQRSRSVSVMVNIGPATTKISTLQARFERDQDNVSRWGVNVTPRDDAGNHLGPGFAERVRVHLDGIRQAAAVDLGNGAYYVPLNTSATMEKPLRVAVGGQELFNGALSEIAPPPTVSPRDPWQYGIALCLVLLVLWWFRRALRPNAARSGRRR